MKMVSDKKISFCGGSNIYINIIMWKYKIVIPSKLQKYVFNWYHAYLLHPGMDRTGLMICQHFSCPGIRHSVWKEVTNCDTCQHTKLPNKKYSKLPAKKAEEIPWNKLFVDIIGLYVTQIKVRKLKLLLKAVTMIDHVILWF